jgi:hypothetical protein
MDGFDGYLDYQIQILGGTRFPFAHSAIAPPNKRRTAKRLLFN